MGAALAAGGRRVVTVLAGRSEATVARAGRAGLVDVGSLEAVAEQADLVLSIVPPAAAEALAAELAAAARAVGRAPLFVDANAVAPATTERMAARLAEAGVAFVDGGLVGAPPAAGRVPTRLYLSGPRAAELAPLHDPERGLDVRILGERVGRASGLKMAYAALTKGTMTLHAAVLVLAWRLGLFPELRLELEESQPEAFARMRILPFLPADAERWVGEMEEIADTFRAAGLPAGFHEAAAALFAGLARTPFAAETRETLDTSRTLEEAIPVFSDHLGPDPSGGDERG